MARSRIEEKGTRMTTSKEQGYVLFVFARLLSAALLIWAYGRHRYIFYQLVKLVVVAVTVYGVYYTHKLESKMWMVVFAVMAILFSPFVPLRLNRQTWEVCDLAAAAVLLLSVFLVKPTSKELREGRENE
jgi:presenilin-like A22 family membrane protease